MRQLMERPDRELIALLAPEGVLRAGINLSNFLLVTGRTPEGDPVGVSPGMARALADVLGLPVRYVCYESPGLVADAAERDEWDVALIGAEPQRAAVIAFTPAYAEIEATYLVPEGSPITRIADVDRPGVRVAVTDRTAYGLWLDRNIAHAELVRTSTIDDAAKVFVEESLEALAGLLPRLTKDVRAIPGSRILDGRYMTVQQAMGTPVRTAAAIDWLSTFVRHAVETGFVKELIAKYAVDGLTVAKSMTV
jgi:polar amino acid transport system substrate-binding protein